MQYGLAWEEREKSYGDVEEKQGLYGELEVATLYPEESDEDVEELPLQVYM